MVCEHIVVYVWSDSPGRDVLVDGVATVVDAVVIVKIAFLGGFVLPEHIVMVDHSEAVEHDVVLGRTVQVEYVALLEHFVVSDTAALSGDSLALVHKAGCFQRKVGETAVGGVVRAESGLMVAPDVERLSAAVTERRGFGGCFGRTCQPL